MRGKSKRCKRYMKNKKRNIRRSHTWREKKKEEEGDEEDEEERKTV